MTAADFLSYFDETRFIKELRSHSKDGALSEMATILAQHGGIGDPSVVLEMIRRRESLGSTALGKGVAIPHGRTTIATHTQVVFARSRKGVDYDALDGEPCRLLFLIVAPYEDRRHEYLPLLGKIVEVVGEEPVRGRLLEASTFAEFRKAIREAFGE
jgi:fructose PTS system EIIBC or EIIC component